jgi:hypothetical protein
LQTHKELPDDAELRLGDGNSAVDDAFVFRSRGVAGTMQDASDESGDDNGPLAQPYDPFDLKGIDEDDAEAGSGSDSEEINLDDL